MGRKWKLRCCDLLGGRAGSLSNTMCPGEAYLHSKFHPDQSNRLVTMRQRHRPTGQTDSSTDRQDRKTTVRYYRANRLINGRPKTVRPMLSERCLSFMSCRPMSVTLVYCGQTVGWMMPFGMEVGLGQGHIVLDGDPAPPKGPQLNNFRPLSVVAKRLDGLGCHWVWR